MAARLNPDTASQLASEIYKRNHEEAQMYEHMDDFGSGHDCGGLIVRAEERTNVEFWRMWKRRTHLNKKKLVKLLKARTTPKFCHFVLEI